MPPPWPPACPGRRERNRQQTEQDLTAAALAEVRERGGVGLSLRAVARRMGMSPAGPYRYVDSREALLTWLIADAFDDLAAALESADTAVATDIPSRLRAVALAPRAWGSPIPTSSGCCSGIRSRGTRRPTVGPPWMPCAGWGPPADPGGVRRRGTRRAPGGHEQPRPALPDTGVGPVPAGLGSAPRADQPGGVRPAPLVTVRRPPVPSGHVVACRPSPLRPPARDGLDRRRSGPDRLRRR